MTRKIRIALLWAAVILAITAVNVRDAGSASVTPEQARNIWLVAWGGTHDLHGGDRELMESPPTINIAPQPLLCVLYKLPPDCTGLLGLTLPGGEAVYINEEVDFDTVFGVSILFHEFIHSIQHRTRGTAKTCEQADYYEKDARWRHSALLRKLGRNDLADRVLSTYSPADCK